MKEKTSSLLAELNTRRKEKQKEKRKKLLPQATSLSQPTQ